MQTSLTKDELYYYLKHQVDSFFYDKHNWDGEEHDIRIAIDDALDRLEYCFKYVALRGYRDENKEPVFNHLHSDQYAQFLYYFMNSLWVNSQNRIICDKIINLNKMLNGFFVSYNAGLPDIFLFLHPVGTVIGNADYGDFFAVYQNCTIVTRNLMKTENHFGDGVLLASGVKLIDNISSIGDRVTFGANVMWRKGKIESDSIVYQDIDGKIVVKKRDKEDYYKLMSKHFDLEMMKKKMNE